MSISTALTALADDVSAAKAAIEAKGGTAPNGTADMADAIAAIPSGGITPTGKITITENGTDIDVAQYALADVNVSGGGGSLPSVISKIDGGSFTLTTETVVTLKIEHNLGVVPRGVAVWVEDEAMGQYIYGGALIRVNSTSALDSVMRCIVNRSGGSVATNSSMQTPTSSFLTDTDWLFNHGAYRYQAGKTYKWLAWA